MYQTTIFDFLEDKQEFKIDKPVRMIELFGGYGSQLMAMKRIGADVTSHFLCEIDKYAVKSFNAVHGTNYEPTDIKELKGKDLGIKDTDKYIYMMTYSFPCTDLSIAGKQMGMSRDSGTRSGLLWEVERLLKEIDAEGGELPQILFMENVKQVIGTKNKADFDEWVKFLESLGYSNYYQILNAKDYADVAQNRERCFMFSFLGSYQYTFPDKIPLTKCIEDYLEPEEDVDEKYYLRGERVDKLIDNLILDGKI